MNLSKPSARHLIFLFSSFILFISNVSTQNLSLSALLDLKNMTNVASGSLSMSPEESPGIVTVINREDIKRLGAQDITDVLRTIPGIDFGTDTQELQGIGIRGLWGNEGKVLVMIDGIEMNEQQYSSPQFGSHYPLSTIQRIEIIRGPGSALYGGYAEFAVINIVTRNPDLNDGFHIEMAQGAATGVKAWNNPIWVEQNYSFAARQSWGDFIFDLNGLLGFDKRSDGVYTDATGQSYDMTEKNSWLRPTELNGAITWKDIQIYGLYDYYNVKTQSSYAYVLPEASHNNFTTYALGSKANWEIFDEIHFMPQIEYRAQIPWQAFNISPDSSLLPAYGYQNQVAFVDLHFSWKPLDNLNFDLGHKLTWASMNTILDTNLYGVQQSLSPTDSTDNKISYLDYATYAQIIYQSWVNLTLGARDEYDSYIHANSFVPRFAVTKAWDQFHIKLLASEAFRAPAFQNVLSNQDASVQQEQSGLPGFNPIKPEQTTVFESEFGYKYNDHWESCLNLFDTKIKSPIIFTSTSSISDNYVNAQNWGSMGLEAQSKYHDDHWYAELGYSYYYALLSDSLVHAQYAVPGHPGMSLGFPTHKVSAEISYHSLIWMLSTNGIFNTEKYGVTSQDSAGNYLVTRLAPTLIWNAHYRLSPEFAKGGFIDLGCQNILNQNYLLAQPYMGGHAPLPTPSRTFFINLGWQIGLN